MLGRKDSCIFIYGILRSWKDNLIFRNTEEKSYFNDYKEHFYLPGNAKNKRRTVRENKHNCCFKEQEDFC